MPGVAPKAPPSPAAIVAAAVLGTRLPILLLGALAVAIAGTVPPPAAEAVWRVSAHEVTNLLARWDTFFYYTIATEGYHWDPVIFRHYNVVFFPLYALLMRWGGFVLGGHELIAGLIVSLTAFTGAMVMVYRLARLDVGEEYAWRVILLISTFPYALYFSAVYTESLFLFLSVSAFYAMRRGRLGWVAVCGGAAGLTRPNGFWLALPLACLALWPPDRGAAGDSPGRPVRLSMALTAAAVPLIGVLIFSGYLYWRFGDAIAWVHGQAAWGVPLLLRRGAPDPGKLPGELAIKPIEVVVWIGNIAAFVTAMLAIRPISKRFGLAYGAWVAINIFPPVAAHLFMSLGRFVSVLFPFFFWLAIRVPRNRVVRVAGVFAACQAIFAIWFFLWRPVV
ncbi:MAG: putative integral rane protein [Acidobacteria bacterium]|nr:putative integral rane protein [Acidobacteriota bacterium]